MGDFEPVKPRTGSAGIIYIHMGGDFKLLLLSFYVPRLSFQFMNTNPNGCSPPV